tara:strand:+ start:175 stop:1104 length:930 start_codon:yes stop_codon:yes gene_type:complete
MLQIYILSRNRVDLLEKTLISAITQKYKDIQIIVSDNSDSFQISDMMSKNFKNIKYIKREPVLPPFDHVATIIEEASAEYLMIFHDDDILKVNHASDLISKIKSFPDVSAVASNADLIGDVFYKNRQFMTIKNDTLISSPAELFEHYLGLHPSGISPAAFPGYIYRTSMLKKTNKTFVNKCAMFGDVQLLSEILSQGKILWLPQSTFYYRVWSGQTSSREKIYDRIKLLNFMSSYGIKLNSDSVKYFKLLYLWRYWKRDNKRVIRYPRLLRDRIILKFIFLSFCHLILYNSIFSKKKILGQIYIVFFKS